MQTSTDFLRHYEAEYIYISYFILFFGLLQNAIYLIQVPLAFLEIFTKKRWYDTKEHSWWLLTSKITEKISIIIPAYNESVGIKTNIYSILSIKYPNFDVIIVNDGSKDNTLDILIKEFDLYKTNMAYEDGTPHQPINTIYKSNYYNNMIVIDKQNGGKADAINAGINLSRSPLFCVVDADSIIETESLLKTMQPFIDDPENLIAVGGMVRIGNGCKVVDGEIKEINLPKKLLPLFQTIEYVRAFFMGRLSWSRLGVLTIVSGAFGVFDREAVLKVNGYSTNTIGEDYELILKLHHHFLQNKIPYKIKFVPEPVCWTEVPEDLHTLKKQRIRWQVGALEGFFKYWKMFFNPKYKKIGLIAFPSIFIFDVIGPILEVLGYIMIPLGFLMGIINAKVLLLFFTIFFIIGVLISMLSLILEEISLARFTNAKDLLKIGLMAIFENFGYRQITNLWRIIGWKNFLLKKKEWGNMKRKGYEKV